VLGKIDGSGRGVYILRQYHLAEGVYYIYKTFFDCFVKGNIEDAGGGIGGNSESIGT
jgi:hypothetical protein